MVKKYRKKPVVVEAIHWFDDGEEAFIALMRFCNKCYFRASNRELTIATLEGEMLVSPGDYIIKGTKGEFYPCKPDIFEDIYTEELENAS